MADDPLRNLNMIPGLAKGCQQLAEILARENHPLTEFAPGVLTLTAEFLLNAKQALETMPAVVVRAKIATTFATYTDVADFARVMADEIAAGSRSPLTAQSALRQFAASLERAAEEQRHVTGISPEKPAQKRKLLM